MPTVTTVRYPRPTPTFVVVVVVVVVALVPVVMVMVLVVSRAVAGVAAAVVRSSRAGLVVLW